MFDGAMAYHHSGKAPVCAINSDGGLERTRLVANNGGEADRQMVQSDDRRDNGEDFGQSGFPESEVPMRVSVQGWSIRSPVTERREPVLSRAFQFWNNIDGRYRRPIEERFASDRKSTRLNSSH